MPPPNAAPRPSFFGRCMSTSKTMSSDTRTWITKRILITMDSMAGARNMEERGAGVKWKFSPGDESWRKWENVAICSDVLFRNPSSVGRPHFRGAPQIGRISHGFADEGNRRMGPGHQGRHAGSHRLDFTRRGETPIAPRGIRVPAPYQVWLRQEAYDYLDSLDLVE